MKIGSSDYQKIVIKIGSSLIVQDDKIRLKWLKSFVGNVVEIMQNSNCQITIVSSGAVALGRLKLKLLNKKLSIQQKQACAGVGQIDLITFYKDFFQELDLKVAQILLTATDCNVRESYLNCKNTIENLLENNIIPIINENDSVTIKEIKIGDNDRLSARVSQMIGADLMILLSDIDGLYEDNPKTNPDAKFIKRVEKINSDIEKMAKGSGSSVGTGGMVTKIMAAKMVNRSECDAIITSGLEENALKNLMSDDKKFTLFVASSKSKKSKHNSLARKSWLSGLVNPKGCLIINDNAVEALKSGKVSLLPVGVIDTEGDFLRGDLIFIKNAEGTHIASGITNYDSEIARKILQKKSKEIKKILGEGAKTELVHIDNLVIVN